jgi:siroheme synthase-like protein
VNAYYMACLDLRGRRCVVVGGGTVGVEKTKGLLACGAEVTVVSPELHDDLRRLDVTWRRGRYRRRDLRGAFLVIAATSDRTTNERVHRDAEARAMLCNVADVHREGPIAVAVSTGGASPALAKRIRDDVAAIVTSDHAELARRLEAIRPAVKERFPSYEERRNFFESLVEEALT